MENDDIVALSTKQRTQLDERLLDVCRRELSDKPLRCGQIALVLDVQDMPCPMPLLKTKVALRGIDDGQGVYVLAGDKNSQTDLVAFCQKNHHQVQTWVSGDDGVTIFHFIIIKNSSF